MRTLRLALLAIAALTAAPLDHFAPLLGRWEAAGQFAGSPAQAHYEWQRALGGRFIQLQYRVVREGKTVFEGHGYYHADNTGTWLDSEGHQYSITWRATGSAIVSQWGDGGESTYAATNGAAQVTDRIKGRAFAEFQLKRPPAR
jgi:hypothetical protein